MFFAHVGMRFHLSLHIIYHHIMSSTTLANGDWMPAPTLADNLLILAGIQPAELRRNGATLSLARRAMEPGHLLHSTLTRPLSAKTRHLKSRH